MAKEEKKGRKEKKDRKDKKEDGGGAHRGKKDTNAMSFDELVIMVQNGILFEQTLTSERNTRRRRTNACRPPYKWRWRGSRRKRARAYTRDGGGDDAKVCREDGNEELTRPLFSA